MSAARRMATRTWVSASARSRVPPVGTISAGPEPRARPRSGPTVGAAIDAGHVQDAGQPDEQRQDEARIVEPGRPGVAAPAGGDHGHRKRRCRTYGSSRMSRPAQPGAGHRGSGPGRMVARLCRGRAAVHARQRTGPDGSPAAGLQVRTDARRVSGLPPEPPQLAQVPGHQQHAGKVRLALSPMVNHWWQTTLYVSARGLTPSPIPHGSEVPDRLRLPRPPSPDHDQHGRRGGLRSGADGAGGLLPPGDGHAPRPRHRRGDLAHPARHSRPDSL